MKVRITYVFHNCFVLESKDLLMLFDMPERRYLDEDSTRVLESCLATDKPLYAFASHAHPDHFSKELFELERGRKSAAFIVSSDTCAGPGPAARLFPMGPGERMTIDGMAIETIASNDAGVAFLIENNSVKIYFGGDLAKWTWEEFDRATRDRMEAVFAGALRYLTEKGVDLAFSNADPRMDIFSGASEFVNSVRPKAFVPMHSFGDATAMRGFAAGVVHDGTRIFMYDKSGDSMEIEL